MEYFGTESFAYTLISWYDRNRRDLPWRHTRDPYKIWLSEVILQQTRVAQGLPYYQSFCEHFPEVSDLASANEQQILRLWQGLGYYSRARNLLRCAQRIVDTYDGKFPEDYQQLLTLPGVGDYTAAAIASFAFGQSVPVVDGNVFRVLSRILGLHNDIALSGTKKVFKQYSSRLMNEAPPDRYNQAIMEFGALQCTPVRPKCHSCPFSANCHAFQTGNQKLFPVKGNKTKVRNRYFYYYVIKLGQNILLKERTGKDIWRGLYDFFLLEPGNEADPLELFAVNLPNVKWIDQVEVGEPSVTYRHKLSHQLISAQFMIIETNNTQVFEHFKQEFELSEFEVSDVHQLPKSILIDNYLKADIF
ncbi:MAG: A/G-specific adenine glycosylase [Cyclobacteriaceae bacterium]|nr:MAG: A/G-specific adenine glycosylase [Cyclobacteriaceae bacterium]